MFPVDHKLWSTVLPVEEKNTKFFINQNTTTGQQNTTRDDTTINNETMDTTTTTTPTPQPKQHDTIPTRNGRELGEIWVSKVGTNF